MKVKTTRWGEVEAHYFRDRDGEGLYVGDGQPTLWQWSSTPKVGPPPVLIASDFPNPQAWGQLLVDVLAADIEDAKFSYRAPPADGPASKPARGKGPVKP